MKNLVWLAGLLLVVAFLFPNGINLPKPAPTPTPAPAPVAPTAQPDPAIVGLLAKASRADKQRIKDVYTALKTIIRRDNGNLIKTTEQWATWHSNTLTLAIEQPGKYPGLDEAIETVFMTTVGTDDIVPNNEATRSKLVTACEIVAASAN